jgi:L,D-transpeptidase ErfK/SrfK
MKYYCKLFFAAAIAFFLVGCATNRLASPGHAGRKRIAAPTKSKHGRNFYGKELCKAKGFHCITVHSNDTWAKLFPDKKERDMVKRLNRLNMPIRYRDWIVVPNDLKNITYNDFVAISFKIETNW